MRAEALCCALGPGGVPILLEGNKTLIRFSGPRRRGLVVVTAVVTAAAVGVGAMLLAPTAQGVGSVRSSVSLSTPASGAYGSTIALTGKVWRTGTTTVVPGATVYLQRSVHGQGRYGNLTSTRATSAGTFAFSVKQVGAYDFRAYYPGSATYSRAYSPVRYPVTNRHLALQSIATANADTGMLRVTGYATPNPPNGTRVYLQRFSTETKAWYTIGTGATSSGKFIINTTRPGSTSSYRLVGGASYPYGPGTTTARQFAHYVWRGAFTKHPMDTTSQGNVTVELRTGSVIEAAIMSSQGHFRTRLPAANCLEAKVRTTNHLPATLSTFFGSATDSEVLATAGGGVTNLSVDVSRSQYVEYAANTPNSAPIHVTALMQMRCAN